MTPVAGRRAARGCRRARYRPACGAGGADQGPQASLARTRRAISCHVTYAAVAGKMLPAMDDREQRMSGGRVRPGWYDGLAHVWLPYAQMKTVAPPLPVVQTRGSRIVLADGRELIDGIASWWTACHGYNHPHIRAAVERQLAVMPHVMFGGLVHEQALTLAQRLTARLPRGLDRVFFCDSGSVAVEVALKMAVQYWLNRGLRGRSKFVAFKGGYHG